MSKYFNIRLGNKIINTVKVKHLSTEKVKQKKIVVLGKRILMSLFGTIDAITGKFLCTKVDCCNAETFQQFLIYVLKEYKNKHVVLVLDNARYHHA